MGRSLRVGRQIRYLLLGILTLFPLLSLSSPTSSSRTLQSKTETRDESEDCGFTGDDNTYGLGIRLGVYIQWITSTIAFNFVPSEAVSIRGVNNCFQAAMFAGLLFITITKGSDLFAVEAMIMLMFCVGGVCVGENPTQEEKTKRTEDRSTYMLGYLFFLVLALALCAYGMWFTFKGMDNMKHPKCSTYAFLYTRVNLYGWARTLFKVLFTLATFVCGIAVIKRSPSLITEYWRRVQKGSVNSVDEVDLVIQNLVQTPVRHPTVPREPSRTSLVLKIILSFLIVPFVVAVELMVRWNHIRGVNSLGSTGQLLPLIIGVFGILRVFHHLLVFSFKKKV